MFVSRSVALWLGCVLAISIAAIAGDPSHVSGSLTTNGKTTELKYGYAQAKPDPFDKKKTATFLLVTDKEVPAEALADEFEFMRWYEKASLSGFAVLINGEKRVVSGNVYSPSLKHNGFSGVGMQQVDLTAMTPQHIAGKISIPKPDDFFGDAYQYTATFDVPLGTPKVAAPPPLKGSPLPAGGGEPAKAYTSYRKAIASGDLAGVRKSVASERAKQMDSPDFKKMFPMIQAMQPKNIKVTGGSVDGELATLLVSAKEGKETSSGTITLIREGGVWKVKEESWKTESE